MKAGKVFNDAIDTLGSEAKSVKQTVARKMKTLGNEMGLSSRDSKKLGGMAPRNAFDGIRKQAEQMKSAVMNSGVASAVGKLMNGTIADAPRNLKRVAKEGQKIGEKLTDANLEKLAKKTSERVGRKMSEAKRYVETHSPEQAFKSVAKKMGRAADKADRKMGEAKRYMETHSPEQAATSVIKKIRDQFR